MKEFVTDEIIELQKQADETWDKYNELKDLIREKKKECVNLDFEGKFIKYDDGYGRIIYMEVEWVVADKIRHGDKDFSYMFRGLGFDGEYTGYGDATNFTWDYWYEFYIYGDEKQFLDSIDKIEEITREEFNKAFDEQIEKVKEYHYKNKDNKEDE